MISNVVGLTLTDPEWECLSAVLTALPYYSTPTPRGYVLEHESGRVVSGIPYANEVDPYTELTVVIVPNVFRYYITGRRLFSD